MRFLQKLDQWVPHSGYLLVSALVLRLLVWAAYAGLKGGLPPLTAVAGPLGAEAGVDGYLQLAHTLLEHGQYRFVPDGPAVYHRAPGQALLFVPQLALAKALGIPWWGVWAVVSSLLGTLQVWLGIQLVRQWGGSTQSQRVAGLLLAFNPLLILAVRPTTPVLLAGLGVLGVLLLLAGLRAEWGRLFCWASVPDCCPYCTPAWWCSFPWCCCYGISGRMPVPVKTC